MSRSRKNDRRTRRGKHCGRSCTWCANNRMHPRDKVHAAAEQDVEQYCEGERHPYRNTAYNYHE